MIDHVINLINKDVSFHTFRSPVYQFINNCLIDFINKSNLTKKRNAIIKSNIFGNINFPFFSMGNITSLHLFGLDELILFSFYHHNKKNYKKVADIGANIGLHTLIMSRCGWSVESFEPDPIHHKRLMYNLKKNNVTKKIKLYRSAVSSFNGETQFIRVIGNTTGSHILNSKKNIYGEIAQFDVAVVDIKDIFNKFDLIKLDVEGHEATIINETNKSSWKDTDMVCEVGSKLNATKIFNHLRKIKVNCFSQKNNWQKVTKLSDMPISYKEGSLFISIKKKMNWN